MADRFQYPVQAATDPETLNAPLRDEIQWWIELSQPTRRRASVANFPSFFIDPEALGEAEAAEVVTLDEYQALSEPLPPIRRQHPDAAIIDSATLDAPLRDEIQWFQPLSEPVLPLHRLQRAEAAVIDVATLDAPLRDELQWYQDLNTPIFVPHQVRPGVSVIDTETLGEGLRDELQWFRDLDQPTRRKDVAIEAAAVFVDEVAVAPPEDLLEWFNPLSIPMLPVPPAIEAGSVFVDEVAAPVTPAAARARALPFLVNIGRLLGR